MAPNVGSIVARSVVVVAADWTVMRVAQAMRDEGANAAIVDHGDGFCLVTDRDIAHHGVAAGQSPEQVVVGSISCRALVYLSPTATVDDAIRLMRQSGFSRLAVVKDGAAIGIVSLAELALERDLEGDLGSASFFFRGPSGHLDLRAPNLMAFMQLAARVDDATWLHHLHNGDYYRWFQETLRDPVLAAEAARLEASEQYSAAESRAAIKAAVKQLYSAF